MLLFNKPPGVPCPPNNPHCQGDVPSVPIHSDILTFIIVDGILIYMLWIFKKQKL